MDTESQSNFDLYQEIRYSGSLSAGMLHNLARRELVRRGANGDDQAQIILEDYLDEFNYNFKN
ncbi:hypothetical protein [Paucilactobacillus nenjiangensis]|uniref:hypothetical protein n=1 Tax=Paucilactobacillus nenjiangensis TaxID=1296540 RepID=UPI003BAFA529